MDSRPRLLWNCNEADFAHGDIIISIHDKKAWRQAAKPEPLQVVEFNNKHEVRIPLDPRFNSVANNWQRVQVGMRSWPHFDPFCLAIEMPRAEVGLKADKGVTDLPWEHAELVIRTDSAQLVRLVYDRSLGPEFEFHFTLIWVDRNLSFNYVRNEYNDYKVVLCRLLVKSDDTHRFIDKSLLPPQWQIVYSRIYEYDTRLLGPHETRPQAIEAVKRVSSTAQIKLVQPDRHGLSRIETPDWLPRAQFRWPYWYVYIRELYMALYPVLRTTYPLIWILDEMPHMSRWTRLGKVRCLEGVHGSIRRLLDQRDQTK